MSEQTNNSTRENDRDWYAAIEREIDSHRDTVDEKHFIQHRFDLLLRLARRVYEFSPECRKCRKFHVKIQSYAEIIEELVEAEKEDKDDYFKMLDNLTEHLQISHRLITNRTYRKLGSAFGGLIGLSAGGALGQTLGSIPVGLVSGAAAGWFMGMLVGGVMDSAEDRKGQMI